MKEFEKFIFGDEAFLLVHEDDYIALVSEEFSGAQWIVTEFVLQEQQLFEKVVRFLRRLENLEVGISKVKAMLEGFIERETLKLTLQSL